MLRPAWPVAAPAAELFLADRLEHPNDTLHAGNGAHHLGGAVGFALGDPSHQVHRAALGDHLESTSVEVIGIDQRCADLRRDQRVGRALRQRRVCP